MFFNRFNFRIRDFTAKKGVRPEMEGVFIAPQKTVATDGFQLIEVESVQANPDDFPKIPNRKPFKKDFSPFILPKEKAGDVASLLKGKDNPNIPIINNAVVMDKKEGAVEIGKTDLESYNSISSRITDDRFPEYKDIMAEKGKHIEISLNPLFLKSIAGFFSQFADDNIRGLTIRVPVEKNKPIRFFCERKETGQRARAVLMPLQRE